MWSSKYRLLVWVALYALVALGAIFGFREARSVLGSHTPEEGSLSGNWEVCLPQSDLELWRIPRHCAREKISVPGDLQNQLGKRFQGRAIYFHRFSVPNYCLDSANACSLVLAEVGDAFEVWINGRSLGRRGNFPPHAKYARLYPGRFDLPVNLLRKGAMANEITVSVYSMKLTQAGIRRSPVAIMDTEEAAATTRWIISFNVIFPILCSIILCLVGLFHLVASAARQVKDPVQRSFIAFCLASSVFLVSFSEIPRQFLPIGLAGYLHFSTRTLFDLTFFLLVWRYYHYSTRWRRWLGGTYLTLFFSFWAEYLLDSFGFRLFGQITGFDLAYWTMRVAAPLVLFPSLMGFAGSIHRRDPHRLALLVLFTVLVPMQLWDICVFHGVLKGAYLVKFSPALVGLVYGWVLMERYQADFHRFLLADQKAQQAAQVAHDIQSPLTALNLALGDSENLSEPNRILARGAVNRIHDITNQLMLRGRRKTANREQAIDPESPCLVLSLVQEIVSERRIQYRARDGISIQFEHGQDSYGLCAKIHRVEWMRVVSNLIGNAVEAIGEGNGTVKVSLSGTSKEVLLGIEDDGCGMSREELERLREVGGTFNKKGGSGLGLSHARKWVERWNGKVSISSQPGKGTSVQLKLPRCKPPDWHVPSIDLRAGQTVVVVDDDDSMHEFWKSRLSSAPSSKMPPLLNYHSATEFLDDRLVIEQLRDKSVFLIDQEFVGDSLTGIELIERLRLFDQAILVTSHADESQLLEKTLSLKVPLLSKNTAEWVQIQFPV